MRLTKLHINAVIGMLSLSGLTAALIVLAWGLAFGGFATNGSNDLKFLIVGALLPMISQSLRELASVVKRFTYMGDDDNGQEI